MSDLQPSSKKLNAVQRFGLTASPTKLALISALFVALITSLTVAIVRLFDEDVSFTDSLTILAFTLPVTYLIFIAIYIPLFTWQRRDFDKRMGVTTTAADRLALATWFNRGTTPKSAHLRPYLQNYIKYLERTTTGSIFPAGRKYNYGMVALGVIIICLQVVSYISGEDSLFETLLFCTIFGVFIFMWMPGKKDQPNTFYRIFGRNNREKIARMKRQVTEAE